MNPTVRPVTYDALALEILLSNAPASKKQERLGVLAREAEKRTTGGPCPECSYAGPHEDNGCSGSERSFCCGNCGTHWDAQEV